MTSYVLTKDAENDLREIARYTLKNHGVKKLQYYKGEINKKLNEIGKGKALERNFFENLPQVHVAKCEHHFIFFVTDNCVKPIIIAIIHESSDIVSRIKNRI